jgi:uncharacterized membrane protein YhdT
MNHLHAKVSNPMYGSGFITLYFLQSFTSHDMCFIVQNGFITLYFSNSSATFIFFRFWILLFQKHQSMWNKGIIPGGMLMRKCLWHLYLISSFFFQPHIYIIFIKSICHLRYNIHEMLHIYLTGQKSIESFSRWYTVTCLINSLFYISIKIIIRCWPRDMQYNHLFSRLITPLRIDW